MDCGTVVQAPSIGMLTVVDSEIADEQTGVSSSHTAVRMLADHADLPRQED